MNRVFCQFFDHRLVLPDHVCFYGIRRIIYQKKQLKVWMGIFKFFIEGRYCCLADFSGICIQPTWLYRENYNETVDSISSRSEFRSDWRWKAPMLVGFIRRKRHYFVKNDVFIVHILTDCPNEKEIDILFVCHYDYALSN